jgi:hypothetical protein
VSGDIREEIMNSLGVHNEALSEKYLGMPTDVGSSTIGAFKYIKDRVWKKVHGWMEQTLPAGGKEVLIKQWRKLCRPSLCLVSGCHEDCASTLTNYSEASGGGARRVRGRRVGLHGKR